MICACIAEPDTKSALARMAETRRWAELFEIRLDGMARPDLARLFAPGPRPTIATCRRVGEGGAWRGSERRRLALLRAAAKVGADFVDIERDAARSLGPIFGARRIVSYHDFAGMPADLPGLARSLWALEADVIKIAAVPRGFADALALLELPERCRRPAVVLGMGAAGLPTRALLPLFSGAWTCAAAAVGRETAPGQPTARELVERYRYRRLDEHTALFGVVGDPVGHSVGPGLFNRLFARLGTNAIYLPFLCRDRADLAALLRLPAVQGLSVTIPHKELALRVVDAASPAATAIGAANTLVRTGGKAPPRGHRTARRDRWYAENTDEPAVADSIVRLAALAGLPSPSGLDALVLGAGGAARAAVHALRRLGCRIAVSGRTGARARALARGLGVAFAPWSSLADRRPDLLVNATPVGMSPRTDAIPLPPAMIRPGMLVLDLVYTPPETRWVREARKRGAFALGGFDMFVDQAALQAELFTGVKPDRRRLERWVREALRAR